MGFLLAATAVLVWIFLIDSYNNVMWIVMAALMVGYAAEVVYKKRRH